MTRASPTGTACVLALRRLGEKVEQLPDVLVRLSGVPHGDLAVDHVPVSPSRAPYLDVPRCHEVGDDPLNGPLGDADGDRDIAQPDVRIARDADQHLGHVTARFGYMDTPDVPSLLPLIRESTIESPLDEENLSYFLSTIDLHRGDAPGLSRWRKSLFLATSRLTADAAEYFNLPIERTVIMGSRIEL